MTIEAKLCCSYCMDEIDSRETHVYQGRDGEFFHYDRCCDTQHAASGDAVEGTRYILWTRSEALEMVRDSLEGRAIPLIKREKGRGAAGSIRAR